ncbi:uncharacterized protein B0T15DRAFT_533988 [Chaetomium strumarium]|uniref:DUF3626 domain-containing protein n=1 Tax=Chaetomium strumarium TaxID=1170767 RepID=A0AAJ0M266_9PEZI|nr:hypothetical protein B0T15DRAFT_533988 [Chaetomium strumarium]
MNPPPPESPPLSSLSPPLLLHPSQKAAIAHIRSTTLALAPAATQTIHHILRMSNLLPPAEIHAALLSAIVTQARVALHFHPDRPVTPVFADGKNKDKNNETIAQSLLDDGVYRNQFETGVSNGSLSAFRGGVRDLWERELFGGAYHNHNHHHSHSHTQEDEQGDTSSIGWRGLRPKYGALGLLGGGTSDDGPAPRFGSCYLVLKREVLARCTFTFGGSQDLPRWRGTVDCFDAVLAAVLEEAFVRESVLGMPGVVRPPELVRRVLDGGSEGVREGLKMSRNLDHYIEAQIHGEVRLDRDVEILVADPSFQEGETGGDLMALSERFGFPLRWHAGSHIGVAEVPADFRGPTMPSLAARVARDGIVDARAIGDAVRELKRNPDTWRDRGSYDEVLQELKLLWHVLVRYGRSPGTTTSSTT